MTKEQIRELRYALGESQSQFAARLGVTSNTVARWEAGRVSPGMFYAERLRRIRGQVERHAAKEANVGKGNYIAPYHHPKPTEPGRSMTGVPNRGGW